jgi:hypothetical protein
MSQPTRTDASWMPDESPATLASVLPPLMPARWCVLEQFGHRRFVGRVTEVELFGQRMGMLEIPRPDGTFEVMQFAGGSVYALSETTEERVRAEIARRFDRLPELPAYPAPDDLDGDDSELEPDDRFELGQPDETE